MFSFDDLAVTLLWQNATPPPKKKKKKKGWILLSLIEYGKPGCVLKSKSLKWTSFLIKII